MGAGTQSVSAARWRARAPSRPRRTGGREHDGRHHRQRRRDHRDGEHPEPPCPERPLPPAPTRDAVVRGAMPGRRASTTMTPPSSSAGWTQSDDAEARQRERSGRASRRAASTAPPATTASAAAARPAPRRAVRSKKTKTVAATATPTEPKSASRASAVAAARLRTVASEPDAPDQPPNDPSRRRRGHRRPDEAQSRRRRRRAAPPARSRPGNRPAGATAQGRRDGRPRSRHDPQRAEQVDARTGDLLGAGVGVHLPRRPWRRSIEVADPPSATCVTREPGHVRVVDRGDVEHVRPRGDPDPRPGSRRSPRCEQGPGGRARPSNAVAACSGSPGSVVQSLGDRLRDDPGVPCTATGTSWGWIVLRATGMRNHETDLDHQQRRQHDPDGPRATRCVVPSSTPGRDRAANPMLTPTPRQGRGVDGGRSPLTSGAA